MSKMRSVKCKRCGFVFEVEKKQAFAWMDDFDGCIIGRPDYCDQKKVAQPVKKQLTDA